MLTSVDLSLYFFYFLIDFFNFITRLSWSHDLICEFSKLTLVDLSFFFQFHPSMLGWLRIKFHNLFLFSFFKVIPVSWPESKLIQVFFWSFLIFFFNFILQYLIDWELSLIICFDLLSIWLSWSHELGHEFDRLTLVKLGHFCCFLIEFFNFIFNIWLIKNWALWIVSTCFLWGYPCLIIQVEGLTSYSELTRVFFLFVFNRFFFFNYVLQHEVD